MAVSYVTKHSASDTGTSIAVSITPAATGNILVALVTAIDTGGGQPLIAYDSSFTELEEVYDTLGDFTTIGAAYKIVSSTSNFTLTVTLSGISSAEYIKLDVLEFSGGSVVDAVTQAQTSGTVTSATLPSPTRTKNNNAIIYYVCNTCGSADDASALTISTITDYTKSYTHTLGASADWWATTCAFYATGISLGSSLPSSVTVSTGYPMTIAIAVGGRDDTGGMLGISI